MTTAEAWQSIELAMQRTKTGCPVVVSPAALAIVLADHAQQGEDDE